MPSDNLSLNLVELALGLANEFTTVSVWGKLGREGSKGLQLGIATYHLLLNCTYLCWQLAEATKTEETFGVSDDNIQGVFFNCPSPPGIC